jgi:glycosyltransferase involved in cell wall biosynthesis
MKTVLISKYPPIEGYVSSCTYWLARGLSRKGHKLTVVTNAFEVEDRHRERMSGGDLDLYQERNLSVRNTDPFQDYQLIPGANPFCEKLSAAAIEQAGDADLLDAWYFISYGSAGMLAKAATGLPLVLRHAGSDIGRLGANPHLRPLVRALLKSADAVVAGRGSAPRLRALGAPAGRIHEIPVSVDAGAFDPGVKPADLGIRPDVPVITYVGKVTRGKGLVELLAAAARIKSDFRLLLLTSDAENVRRLAIPPTLRRKLLVRPFVPPWKMPGIIRASRCVVMPEHHFPVKAHSPILPREVLACGTCLVLSEELRAKVAGGSILDGEQAFVVRPEDTYDLARKLETVVRDAEFAQKLGKSGYALSRKLEDFEGYLSSNEKMYRKLL